MDYLTGETSGPVYEFPYSGSTVYRSPFINYDNNPPLPNNYPVFHDSIPYQPSAFNLPGTLQGTPMLGYNPVVFQVPDNVSLSTVLRQLGVDLNSLQRSKTYYDNYNNSSSSINFDVPAKSRRRRPLLCYESSNSDVENHQRSFSYGRRRMVCYDRPEFANDYDQRNTSRRARRLTCREVSDSDSDQGHGLRRSWKSHRRNRSESALQKNNQRAGIHNVLGNVWNQARNASPNSPSSSSNSNLNAQWSTMVNNTSSPSSPGMNNSSPSQPAGGINNLWQSMQNTASPPPQPTGGVNSLWRSMQNTASPPPQPAGGVNSLWQSIQSTANPPLQPTGGVNNLWRSMQNNASPPPQPTGGVNNAWQAMQNNASPPPQPAGGVNNAWQAMQNNASPPPQPAGGVNNAWQAMQNNASPPPQPAGGVNNAWQAMQNPSGPVPSQPIGSAVNTVWNKANNASNQNSSGFLNMFRKKVSTGGTVTALPPTVPPQNQAAMNNFLAASNPSAVANQSNPAVANMWNNMANTQQQGYSMAANPNWNQNSASSPATNAVWNQMSRA